MNTTLTQPDQPDEVFASVESKVDDEDLRRRIRDLEVRAASLQGAGTLGRWLVPSGLALLAFIISLWVAFDPHPHPASVTPVPLEVEEHTFLVSATGGDDTPWVNSGISVKESDRLSFLASGRATMAIHHVVLDAVPDIPPRDPWVGPDGLDRGKTSPLSTSTPQEDWRLRGRIDTRENQGKLLMYIGESPPVARPPAEAILPIGSHATFEPGTHGSGQIYFAVNDVWLDPGFLEELIQEHNEKPWQRKQFLKMKAEHYYKAWFDDNAGGYLVNALVGQE